MLLQDLNQATQVQYPPSKLYFEGSTRAHALLSHLPERGFAIVGTRYPDPQILLQLRKWILELQGMELIIISGLARGVDAMAHQAALDAGLPTIAVLGTPLEVQYPPENEQLRKRIVAADGLVVTEYGPDDIKRPANFIKRNRLIAGWSRATWVVQAPESSGALSTARWARDMHRDTYATPCRPGDLSMAGNQNLIDKDEARPFWGPHCLGETWKELTGLKKKRAKRGGAGRPAPQTDAEHIAAQVELRSSRSGGCSTEDLLDWAVSQNWTPKRYFLGVHQALYERLVLDDCGLLLKNPAT